MSNAAANPRHADLADRADRAEPRRRGQLEIAEKVFEKIAGHAATEIGAARGRSGGVLGIGSEPDTTAAPKVDVDLSADSVDLAIAAGIAYPGSIRAASQQIRDRVREQVQALTGVSVHRVDIDVSFLTTSNSTATDQSRETLR